VEVEIIIGIVLVGTELESDMLDSHSVVVVLTVNVVNKLDVGSEVVVIIISDEDV